MSLVITSPFGRRLNPVTGAEHHHDGIDLAAPIGSPVRSPYWATIERIDVDGVGRGAANGNAVHLTYGAFRWSFLHLSRVVVKAGAKVTRGQCIGYSGNTGRSTAPHLHLQVTVNGVAIDPVSLFPPGTFTLRRTNA